VSECGKPYQLQMWRGLNGCTFLFGFNGTGTPQKKSGRTKLVRKVVKKVLVWNCLKAGKKAKKKPTVFP